MIKAIIFDLWGTLGTKKIGVSKSLSKRFGIKNNHDFLKKYEAAIQLQPWKTKELMAKNFLINFSLPVTKDNVQFITNIIDETLEKASIFQGMKELLEELHKKYKLGLLSNTTVFEAVIPKKWGIQNLFDGEVYSWQINSLKPESKNFEEITSCLDVSPGQCVFVDDFEENVLAANEFGMKGILFISIEKLRNDLNQI